MYERLSEKFNNIGSCCKKVEGGKKTAGGFIWRYEDDLLEEGFVLTYKPKGKVVTQYDWYGNKIAEYENAIEASKQVPSANPDVINDVCRLEKASAGGYVWRYGDDPFETDKFDFSRHYGIVQYDFYGNEIKRYANISEANKTGISRITQCCQGKRSTAGGYVWRYEHDAFNKYPRPKHQTNRWWSFH